MPWFLFAIIDCTGKHFLAGAWYTSHLSAALKKHFWYHQTIGLIHHEAYFSKDEGTAWHLVHFSVPKSSPFLIDSSLISLHTLTLPPVSDAVRIHSHSLGHPWSNAKTLIWIFGEFIISEIKLGPCFKKENVM